MSVLVEKLDGAGFNEVTLTFPNSMLAGEVPALSNFSPLGIAVRIEVEVTDLPEILGVSSGLQRADNVLLAVRTERFKVKINLDPVIVGEIVDKVEAEGEGDEC